MYELFLNLADQWVLYDTDEGNLDAVACFHGREDAEFAREAFERRKGQNHCRSPQADGARTCQMP